MFCKGNYSHSALTYASIMAIFMMLVHGKIYADFNSSNEEGKSLAESLNQSIENSASNPMLDNIPHYQGDDVEERDYYDRGLGIEEDALIHAADDETSSFISTSRNTRPNFEIDKENDPIFKREEEIVDLSRSLTETYDGCVQLPVGTEDVTNIEQRECSVFGRQEVVEFSCQRSIELSCSNADAGQPDPYSLEDFTLSGDDDPVWNNGEIFYFGSRGNNRNGSCTWYTRTIRFYVEDVNLITDFRVLEIIYDDWLDITINSNLAFRAIGGQRGTHLEGNFRCEHGRVWSAPGFDARSYLRRGWNTIQLDNLVYGGGNAFIALSLRRKKGCDISEETHYQCDGDERHFNGELLSSECVESGERIIDGFPIHRNCWRWNERYSRLENPTFQREELCDEIEAAGCGQVAAECVVNGSDFCQQERLRYECVSVDAARHTDLCGDILVCPDGNCGEEYQTQKDVTDDFRRAATGLAIADEIASEFDHDNLTVFTGQPRTCQRKSLGFANCCRDSGWGVGIGLDQCTPEEEALGQSREAGAAHYVGEYSSGSWPDERDYFVYCTYPSKLARIIVEQGNAQLVRNYGDARNPVCEGFTTEELESLNFNIMDFSEFISDVDEKANNANIADVDQLVNDMIEKIENL